MLLLSHSRFFVSKVKSSIMMLKMNRETKIIYDLEILIGDKVGDKLGDNAGDGVTEIITDFITMIITKNFARNALLNVDL